MRLLRFGAFLISLVLVSQLSLADTLLANKPSPIPTPSASPKDLQCPKVICPRVAPAPVCPVVSCPAPRCPSVACPVVSCPVVTCPPPKTTSGMSVAEISNKVYICSRIRSIKEVTGYEVDTYNTLNQLSYTSMPPQKLRIILTHVLDLLEQVFGRQSDLRMNDNLYFGISIPAQSQKDALSYDTSPYTGQNLVFKIKLLTGISTKAAAALTSLSCD